MFKFFYSGFVTLDFLLTNNCSLINNKSALANFENNLISQEFVSSMLFLLLSNTKL